MVGVVGVFYRPGFHFDRPGLSVSRHPVLHRFCPLLLMSVVYGSMNATDVLSSIRLEVPSVV